MSILSHWFGPLVKAPTFVRFGKFRSCQCRPVLEILEDRRLPAPLMVSNLNDNGTGSLRQRFSMPTALRGSATSTSAWPARSR